MKNIPLIVLSALLLAADQYTLRAQPTVNKRPEIVRNHDPMMHYRKLAEVNGWQIQPISDGAGKGLYHRIENKFWLLGEFTKEDNPISAYIEFVEIEFTKLGIDVGGGSTLDDEEEGIFQRRVSYKYGETVGVLRATAVLDFKKRFMVDIIIMEFPEK